MAGQDSSGSEQARVRPKKHSQPPRTHTSPITSTASTSTTCTTATTSTPGHPPHTQEFVMIPNPE